LDHPVGQSAVAGADVEDGEPGPVEQVPAAVEEAQLVDRVEQVTGQQRRVGVGDGDRAERAVLAKPVKQATVVDPAQEVRVAPVGLARVGSGVAVADLPEEDAVGAERAKVEV
jgi:hypothetical protein